MDNLSTNTNHNKSKIWAIIEHEYLSRLKSKGFIISTLLAPLALVVFLGITVISSMSFDKTDKKLAILDNSDGIGKEVITKDPKLYYLTNESEADLKQSVLKEKIDGFVVIPQDVVENGIVTVFTKGGGGIGYITVLDRNISEIIRHKRLVNSGLNQQMIDLVDKGVRVETQKINETGKVEKDSTEMMAFVGYILGFAIYLMVFIYGSIVSRGVIEEKTNRIIEIIASSVKPIEIMIGKVVGIGLVGLTQVLFWMILTATLLYFANDILVLTGVNHDMVANSSQLQDMAKSPQAQNIPKNFEMPSISPWIGVLFLFNFLSGYFIYAIFFAGVGAAVENEQDAAQLNMPLTLPVILTTVFIPQVMSNPDSAFSMALSLFPITAPIIMTVRVASTSVPIWQIILSIFIMAVGAYLMLLAASKIYRIGILSSGKKPTFAELFRWLKS